MDNKFKKDFLKGSAAATIGTVSAMLFHFVSIMLLTRNMNPTDFGIYVIILVIVNLFVVISGLGLNITLVKFITGSDETENYSSFRGVIVLRTIHLLISGILFYTLAGLILPLFNLNDSRFVFYIPVIFAFANFRDLFYNLLQGLRYYRKYASVQILSAVIRVMLIYLLLRIDSLNIDNLIFIELATTALAVVIQLFVVPLKKMLSVPSSKDTYKKLLRFSFPVYLNNLLTFSYDRVSIFIIGAFLNPASVALFDIASKIPEALQRMFVSFTIVFFPNQSKLFGEGNIKAASELMSKSLHIFSIIVMSGVLISFLFRQEIIVLLFSRIYIESALPFALLMLNLYLRILSNIMGYSLVASGNSSAPVKINSITTIINLLFSLLFIPVYGFAGAVYALLIMNIISQVIYHSYIVKSQISIDGINYLRPLFIAAVLLISDFIFPGLVALKLFIIAAYFVCSWFFVSEFRNLTSGFTNYLYKKGIFSIN